MTNPIPTRADIEAKIDRLEDLLEFNPTGLPAAGIATELLRLRKLLEEMD
jgi:hypothetical protein